jgi:hypothetical protein
MAVAAGSTHERGAAQRPRTDHGRKTHRRTGDPYGTAPGGMDRILGDLASVEPLLRKTADHEMRTTIPLIDVVAKVLHLVGLSPGSRNTAGPYPGLSTGREGKINDFAHPPMARVATRQLPHNGSVPGPQRAGRPAREADCERPLMPMSTHALPSAPEPT